jgi:hypothetical protein
MKIDQNKLKKGTSEVVSYFLLVVMNNFMDIICSQENFDLSNESEHLQQL